MNRAAQLLLLATAALAGCMASEPPAMRPAAAYGGTETLDMPPLDLDEQEEVDLPRSPDVVYVPTPQSVVDRMLELAEVKPTDVIYDLGCGDGRIVVTAAQRYGVRAVGFDIDPKRVAEARENVKKAGVEALVAIHQRDIFKLDLSPATVVTLYLLPHLNVKLIPQLRKLRPGARIVSHEFAMDGVTPETIEQVHADGQHKLLLWRAPIRVTRPRARTPGP